MSHQHLQPQSTSNTNLNTSNPQLHRIPRNASYDAQTTLHRQLDTLNRSTVNTNTLANPHEHTSDFCKWSVDEVGLWLEDAGLGKYSRQFADNHITGPILPELTHDTLKLLGVVLIGDRHRLLQAAKKLLGNPSPSSSATTTPTSPLPPPLSPYISASKPRVGTPTFVKLPQRLDPTNHQAVLPTSPPRLSSLSPLMGEGLMKPDSLQQMPSSSSQQWWDEPHLRSCVNGSPGRLPPDTSATSATFARSVPAAASPYHQSPHQHSQAYATLPRTQSITSESSLSSSQWAAWVEGSTALPRRTASVPSNSNDIATNLPPSNLTHRDAGARTYQSVESISAAATAQTPSKMPASSSPPKLPRMSKSLEALLGGGPPSSLSSTASTLFPSPLFNKPDPQHPKEATGIQKFLRFRKPSKSGFNEIVAPGGLVSTHDEDMVSTISPLPPNLASLSQNIPTRTESLVRGEALSSAPSDVVIEDTDAGLERSSSADKSWRNKPPHPLVISRNALVPTNNTQQHQPRSPPPPLPSRPLPPTAAASTISSMTEFFAVDSGFWSGSSPKGSSNGLLPSGNVNSAPLVVRPVGKVTSPSQSSPSFLEKMVNKIQARTAPSNDGVVDVAFEARKATCIKVDCKTSKEIAKIIQIVDIADNAFKIRERVLDEVGIHPDERPYYHFYAGTVAHALKDAELVSICKSPNSSLRGSIQLRREQLFPDPEVYRASQRQLSAVCESTVITPALLGSNSGRFITRSGGQETIPAFPSVPRFSQVKDLFFEDGAPSHVAAAVAEDVFERPPSELIVDRFEDWFPELAQKELSDESMARDESLCHTSNINGSSNSTSTNHAVASDEPWVPRSLSVQSDLTFRVPFRGQRTTSNEVGNDETLPRTRTVKDRLAEAMAQRRFSKRASTAAATALRRRSTRRNNIVSMNTHQSVYAKQANDDADIFKERVRSMGQDTWLFQQWENMPSGSALPLAARLAESDDVRSRPRLASIQTEPNNFELPRQRSMPHTIVRNLNAMRPPLHTQRTSSKLAEPPVTAPASEYSSATSAPNVEPMVQIIDWGNERMVEVEPSSATSTDSATSPISLVLAKKWQWTKGRLIGKGSFGSVYMGLVIENENTELVAVKQVALNVSKDRAPPVNADGRIGGMVGDVPHSSKSRDDALVKSKRKMEDALNREIELLKDLDHENIVRYLGFEITDTTLNLFLEYVSGGSVTSLVSRVGKLEEDLTRWITTQVLCGLEYLHERYIIHRDIKGANILVTDEGVAKISDFGISKKHEDRMVYRTQSRMSLQGSIFWMAPEVIKSRSGYSAKVDIWSVGCVMLEMMTGSHPWANFDEIQAMWKLGEGKSAPPLPEDLSHQAHDFLSKGFIIDPEQRPTATDLIEHEFLVEDPEFNFRQAVERAAIMRKMRRRDDDDDASTIGGRTLSFSQFNTMRRVSGEEGQTVTYTKDIHYHMTIDNDESDTMLKLNGLSQTPPRGWN
ncbi:hypothetical protein SeMB42_g04896 [Synchytrium endobioticum]|uniref:Protein kinase domain-containing protein n=1 Tax=Synchytrium endobioticum TaxID=286115 RepID=A0A507CVE4_9FUNG|nr:hypothetical protein SeMB42_g04896 [Synchytrium endobioticum]